MKRPTIARQKRVERRKHVLRDVCEAAGWFLALLRSREDVVSAGLGSCLVLVVVVVVVVVSVDL
jgi:hypothetical protein